MHIDMISYFRLVVFLYLIFPLIVTTVRWGNDTNYHVSDEQRSPWVGFNTHRLPLVKYVENMTSYNETQKSRLLPLGS